MAQSEGKAQPWRELYSKLDIPVPGEPESGVSVTHLADGENTLHDDRFVSKRWFSWRAVTWERRRWTPLLP